MTGKIGTFALGFVAGLTTAAIGTALAGEMERDSQKPVKADESEYNNHAIIDVTQYPSTR